MSRVSVDRDALNSLLSALEGVNKFAGFARAVQSTVKKSETAKEIVRRVVQKTVDNAVDKSKQETDIFAEKQLSLLQSGFNRET